MTATVGRVRLVVLAAAALVAVTAAPRWADVRLERPDMPAPSRIGSAELVTGSDRPSIASVRADVTPASDRPVFARVGKRGEGHRAPSPVDAGAGTSPASIPLAWSVPSGGSVASVGPIALGLSRRGPPGSSVR